MQVEVVFSIRAKMNLFLLIMAMSHWTKGNCRQMEMRVTDTVALGSRHDKVNSPLWLPIVLCACHW